MQASEADPKERILEAAVRLLQEDRDPEKITIRQIAKLAGVGVGLLNYHYQTKENLLTEAWGRIMLSEANRWIGEQHSEAGDPVARLKTLFRQTGAVSLAHPSQSRIGLLHELQYGRMGTSLMTLPTLREIFGKQKDDLELRMIAFMLLSALQAAMLQPEAFQAYMGLELQDPRQLDSLIDLLVDQIILKIK